MLVLDQTYHDWPVIFAQFVSFTFSMLHQWLLKENICANTTPVTSCRYALLLLLTSAVRCCRAVKWVCVRHTTHKHTRWLQWVTTWQTERRRHFMAVRENTANCHLSGKAAHNSGNTNSYQQNEELWKRKLVKRCKINRSGRKRVVVCARLAVCASVSSQIRYDHIVMMCLKG